MNISWLPENGKILVVKETRKGEKRVSLPPEAVEKVIKLGYSVLVEKGAGNAAGFSDQEYLDVGATIRESSEKLNDLFHDVKVILRVKRADRTREILEANALKANTLMLGFLDPIDTTTSHVSEWKNAGITGISLDQLKLTAEDPMSVLAAMSKLAGKLAFDEACKLCKRSDMHRAVVLGVGAVGKAAISTALQKGFSVLAVGTSERGRSEIEQMGAEYAAIPSVDEEGKKEWIRNNLKNADIVLTSARRSGEPAPKLIDAKTLSAMQEGAVVIDLARTEGGNVEGSMNDTTLCLGNNVIVSNNTGYPKLAPREASIAYSAGLVSIIEKLVQEKFNLNNPIFKEAVVGSI